MIKIALLETIETLVTIIKDKFQQKEPGKGLSSNDYTSTDKNKVNTLLPADGTAGQVLIRTETGAKWDDYKPPEKVGIIGPTFITETTQFFFSPSTDNVQWSIKTGGGFASIDQKGVVRLKWKDIQVSGYNVVIQATVNGETYKHTFKIIARHYHPETITINPNDFAICYGYEVKMNDYRSRYIPANTYDVPFLQGYEFENPFNLLMKTAVLVAKKGVFPEDTLISSSTEKGSDDKAFFILHNIERDYDRILLPKGCKSITFNVRKKLPNVTLNFQILDNYTNKYSPLIEDSLYGNKTFDTSALVSGVSANKKRYLSFWFHYSGNRDDILPDFLDLSKLDLSITFNY